MKKYIPHFYLFLILVFALAGCTNAATPTPSRPLPTSAIVTRTLVATPVATATSKKYVSTATFTVQPSSAPTMEKVRSATPPPTVMPTPTFTPSPLPTLIPTITMTPLNTLEPEKANEAIKNLLREPVDCTYPCFWGIVPGQTTAGEARNIFSHLGLKTEIITDQGIDFYNVDYDLDSGLSISVVYTLQNAIVENIEIKIETEKQKAGIPRDWLAYSPETLIKQYGTPSRVDISVDWGPRLFFAMDMYFNEKDLIVEYSSTSITPNLQNWTLQVCPLTAQFESAWLWMGKDPRYPPGPGVPLERVTTLTLDEFSKLMTGDPNHACFIVDGNVFK
jgi:hypothetical protein